MRRLRGDGVRGQKGQAVETNSLFVSWEDAGLEDHVMDWKDENLEAVMRNVTGITEGDIMLSDVWEKKDFGLFGLSSKEISDISDISALGGLTNLQHLSLEGNNINDYSPVGFVPNLSHG